MATTSLLFPKEVSDAGPEDQQLHLPRAAFGDFLRPVSKVKGGVWISTGSHAMFADWMHSIADVANYSYRLMELNRSGRPWLQDRPEVASG